MRSIRNRLFFAAFVIAIDGFMTTSSDSTSRTTGMVMVSLSLSVLLWGAAATAAAFNVVPSSASAPPTRHVRTAFTSIGNLGTMIYLKTQLRPSSKPWTGALYSSGNNHIENNNKWDDSSQQATVANGSDSATLPRKSLLLVPPTPDQNEQLGNEQSLSRRDHITALILLPGCLLPPNQYETVAKAIQREFAGNSACWVVVPKLPLDMANPWSVPRAARRSIAALRAAGYPRDRPVYVGGHSLGGIFLPNLLDDDEPDSDLTDQIAGLVQLGSFVSREQKRKQKKKPRDGIIAAATTKSAFDRTPRLVLNGDLDGLIRVARIAEDFYNHVVLAGDTERDRLHHAVVLVRGMNHFQFVDGKKPPMEQFRDLKPEIGNDEAVQAVASTIAQFMDYHDRRTQDEETNNDNKASLVSSKQGLLAKIAATEEHLSPLIQAMALEGSYHMATPCHYCDGDNNEDSCNVECNVGSPWSAHVQEQILVQGGIFSNEGGGGGGSQTTAVSPVSTTTTVASIRDEFRESWRLNLFADPPFYHPHVSAVVVANGNSNPNNDKNMVKQTRHLEVDTVTEAVYEKPDYFFFDGGFFSNTALELRSKFNSVEAVRHVLGHHVVEEAQQEEETDPSLMLSSPSDRRKKQNDTANNNRNNNNNNDNICSQMNAMTIQWALDHAPAIVRERYTERGIRLRAGHDIEHFSGPSWIWSHLNFGQTGDCHGSDDSGAADVDDERQQEECRIVDSHKMQTPVDHPIPAAGGKLYCKLLSPARVLDWMYTDSLRRRPSWSA